MSFTSRYSNLSLSGKLLLPLLSATIATWGIGAWCFGYTQTSKLEENLESRMLEFASQVEQNFNQRVEILELKARSVVETTAITEAIAQQNRSQLLQSLLPLQTSLNLDLLKVVDNDGQLLVDLRGNELSELTLQSKELEQAAIKGLTFTTIRYDAEINTATLIHLMSPKTAKGIVGGTLFGIRLDETLLTNIKVGAQEKHLLLVQDSTAILSTRASLTGETWPIAALGNGVFQVNLQNQQYLTTEVDLSNAIESDIKLFVLRSTDEITQTKRQFWLLAAGLGTLGAMLTGGISIWATRLVTRRISALTQATENLAKGDFSKPVYVDGQDEVSRLAIGFNTMAEQVNEREQKIRAQMTELGQTLQQLESTKDQLVSQERTYSHTLEEKIQELEKTRQELEIAGHTLETQVETRTHELSNTLQELKETQSQLIQTEKMSSLGQMVAGIAHEINNPISFIQGNIRPLEEYFEGLSEVIEAFQAEYPNPTDAILEIQDDLEVEFLLEDSARILKSMKMGTQRVRDIIVSLRNYSRLDESSIKEVDIHEGIEGTLLILNHRLKQGVEVIKDYGPLPPVTCSPAQLNQVYTNIIANAIDALVEADCQPKQITISTQKVPSHNVQISIKDNGIGIPESIKNKIFDPFFTTKRVGKGTGLGLGICYKIIQQHGGELEVQSEMGQGTEFIITLPIDAQAHQPEEDALRDKGTSHKVVSRATRL